MFPGAFAELSPGKPAAIDAATGEILSHSRLNEESTRLAHHLRALGLRRGDTVALMFTGGVPGVNSVVRFRWNGAGVELIGNTG